MDDLISLRYKLALEVINLQEKIAMEKYKKRMDILIKNGEKQNGRH